MVRHNKAQISSQLFIFIIATLVISLTLIFGVKIIHSFKKSGDEASILQFQKYLERNLGSVDANEEIMVPIVPPSGVKKVCFCGLNELPSTSYTLPICNVNSPGINSFLQQEKKTEDNNTVFLVFYDGSIKSIKVPNLYSEFICFNRTSKLRAVGVGKYIVIKRP